MSTWPLSRRLYREVAGRDASSRRLNLLLGVRLCCSGPKAPSYFLGLRAGEPSARRQHLPLISDEQRPRHRVAASARSERERLPRLMKHSAFRGFFC